jgi:AcrR family transcriptional regulator
VLELFAEGHLRPSATEVAERSGVSLRSVFRYFEDTEELLRAALARSIESTRDLFEIPDLGEGPLDERIDGFVTRRSRLFDAVAPTARATLQAAPRNRLIRDQYELVVQALHDQTEAMFAPELEAMEPAERRAVLAAVDTLTQFPGFDHLRTHEVRTAAQGADALRRALYRLLGDR